MSAPRRRFLLPLLLVETAVLLGLAEGALRLAHIRPLPARVHRAESMLTADPVLGYRLTPGVSDFTLDGKWGRRSFRVTRDPNGHRIAALASPAGAPVLWILGCSFTFGTLLSDDESFPWIAQESLPDYRVVNRGVPGYSTLQSLLQIETELDGPERPAVVVVAYAAFHDARNVCARGWEEALLTRFAYPYARFASGELERFSRLPTAQALPFAGRSALVATAERALDRVDEWRLSAAAVTERLLFACAGRCRARGVRFAVADVRGDPKSVALLGRLEAASIPVLRIAPDYAAPHMAFVGDGHPTPEAARLLGERLAAGLRERVLR